MFGRVKKIHLVGIGGIGMSGIAELLIHWGFDISGSDIRKSENTERLLGLGAKIAIGHRKENVGDCDVVIYSSAVKRDNLELIAADEKGVPVIRRAEMLAEMIKLKPISIAIGGTHGKTTTTSMVGHVFTEAKLEPIIIVGGVVKSTGSPTQPGTGNVIIVEADEFDRSFLKLSPTYAVITTIEADHLDCYASLEEIEKAFIQFANSIPFYGTVAICIDEPSIKKILPSLGKCIRTYGLSQDAEIRAEEISLNKSNSSFDLKFKEETLGRVYLNVPGLHNIKNSLAAIALGLEFDIPFETISSGLRKFYGVRRRFEITDESEDYILVDDYAHHPTEIAATLNAAKSGWNRRVVAVFQPHLFTRTRDFCKEFGESLQIADVIIVLDIYPAREEPIKGVSGKLISDAAINLGHRDVYFIPNREIVPEVVENLIKQGDMIITLGAGDVWMVNKRIKERLGRKIAKGERVEARKE